MAEQLEEVRADAQLMGVVSLSANMTNLDSTTRKQITWAAYREVQQACREALPYIDDLSGTEEGLRHLGDADVSRCRKHCVVSLRGSSLALHEEGGAEVLRASLSGVLTAATLTEEEDPCRVLLTLTPDGSHSFEWPRNDVVCVALVLEAPSQAPLRRILDRIHERNPLARDASPSAGPPSPPPKPLRASRRKPPREATSGGSPPHDEEPPASFGKEASSVHFALTDAEASEAPKMDVCAPFSVSPDSSGHYPLRGQLSVDRAQDRLSGFYDKVPPGPPRKVEENST